MNNLKIDLVSSKDGSKADAIALLWFQSEASESKSATTEPIYLGAKSRETEDLAQRILRNTAFGAKKGEVVLLRFYPFLGVPHLLLVGAGPQSKWTPDVARQVGAALYKAQKREKLGAIAIKGDSLLGSVAPGDQPSFLQGFAEGAWLAGYEYLLTKTKPKEAFYPSRMDIWDVRSPDAKAGIAAARCVAEGTNFARLLGDTPPNIMFPEAMAKHIATMAKTRKIKVSTLGPAQLEREKMHSFLSVSLGSHREPRLIAMEYNGGKKSDAPLVLVGKGVTFDTGGISLKPAAAMDDMKYDMMGAAAVAGALQAIADMKLAVNVVGLIGAVENMPGGGAQRPSDVWTAANGKSIEITNTDAEGRLVLADVLWYAQKYYKPQAVVDVATLTGAVIVCLGQIATGIMGNSQELISRIKKASATTGEKVWELPLFEEYEDDMKSPYADMRNAGNRDAGSSKGGIFLKNFIEKGTAWVHCDIAGTAWNRSDVGYHPSKGASGVFVRLLTNLAQTWSPMPKA